MKVRILALTEIPSQKSFGIFTFVADTGAHDRYICFGYARNTSHSRFSLSKKELDALLAGQGLDLTSRNIIQEVDLHAEHPTVIGWLGTMFRESAERLGILIQRPHTMHALDTGIFWFEESNRARSRLDDFIENASFRVFNMPPENPDAHTLADLMHWALPLAPETLAAKWFVCPDESARLRELALQTSLFSHLPRTPQELQRAHEAVIYEHRLT